MASPLLGEDDDGLDDGRPRSFALEGRCAIDEEEAGPASQQHLAASAPPPWRGPSRSARSACLLVAVGVAAVSLCTVGRWSGLKTGRRSGSHLSGLADERRCSMGQSNCNETKCCEGPGLQCYQQDQYYAQCRPTCAEGPDPTHWDGRQWSCKKLGHRSHGEVACTAPGEDCSKARCCANGGLQCYEKDSSYAACKVECAPRGPDLTDTDGDPWTCRKLGERAPGVAPWVSSKCSESWDNCLKTSCCKAAGHQCYKQNDYYGSCRAAGSCPKDQWSCEEVGVATPSTPMAGGKLAKWVFKQCSKHDGDCSTSRCCLGMDLQCYEKDEFYAQCRHSCTPGRNHHDRNDTWSCRELGPRSYGLAVKGFPSMFCFAVIRIDSYEKGLMEAQHKKGAGIFDCDHFSILTADSSATVAGVKTLSFGGAPIVQSIDNTAGNTELFIHAWRSVVADGAWAEHAFTVKADPDAVFIPLRLRWHLSPFVGKKMFVVNCPMWNMIYGALEVFSYAAITEWARRGDECDSPNNVGEDKYMTNCMDFLHVMRVRDDTVLGDKLCNTFTTCENTGNAAFHPFKDVGSWMQCWDTAMKSMPPS